MKNKRSSISSYWFGIVSRLFKQLPSKNFDSAKMVEHWIVIASKRPVVNYNFEKCQISITPFFIINIDNMTNALLKIPYPQNEPVLSYSPGSPERAKIKEALSKMKGEEADIPMVIGGAAIRTGKKIAVRPPHEHQYILGYYHEGDATHVNAAITAALDAREQWASVSWEHRAAIFLRAADLIAGKYRYEINAATMLGQSKNIYQAEIDSACELIDFFRFNAYYMQSIYTMQPESAEGIWNRMDYRPLEGFVFAITPFNFTAIAANLPAAAALMGNVIVWKPSELQALSANLIIRILKEAGLPDGVINMIFTDGPVAGDIIFRHPDFAGIHFTGSTKVFQDIWETIGANIRRYRSYPRIVGETGGKDFVVIHNSAHVDVAVTALVRGAFEYQGQKCSAASRAYIPMSVWPGIRERLMETVKQLKVGPVENFENFVNAVISEKAFDKITSYIKQAASDPDAIIIAGGGYNKSKGYFIEPTIIHAQTPQYITMQEELFGPVLTIYTYEDELFEEMLNEVNNTSIYALTGSIIANDREIIHIVEKKLMHAAGNFYINDKPTGAVVGQQPFGGSRGSGTNDKAGSLLNLLRWTSPRTIKETFDPPVVYSYPFMQAD